MLANVPTNASTALSTMLQTSASQAQFKALLISEGESQFTERPPQCPHSANTKASHGDVSCVIGLQVTSVELIKVSNGGIVIPVATVETEASSGGGGISGGAIAGIVVGVIGGLALLGRESSIVINCSLHICVRCLIADCWGQWCSRQPSSPDSPHASLVPHDSCRLVLTTHESY